MKKVLTNEELLAKKNDKKVKKAEKKLHKRYTLFRYKKLITFILLGVFIVATVCFGLGMQKLNSLEPVVDDTASTDGLVMFLMIFGAIGLFVLPFFIFRRLSLVAILIGVALWDTSIVFPGMFLEGEGYVLGICLVLYAVVSVLVGEKRRNKQKENHKLNLDQDLIEGILVNSKGDELLDALDSASYKETSYKASLYFTLSIMLIAMTGIGLILPFGKWAYNYNKCLFFMTCNWDVVEDKDKHSENTQVDKPFASVLYGSIYLKGVHFKVVEIQGSAAYDTRAKASLIMSFAYIFVTSMIWRINTRKQSFIDKMNLSLGELTFSGKDIAQINPDIAKLFLAYSREQSEDGRNELIAGLNKWYETTQAENRAEIERINRYEQERDRVQSLYAKDVSVETDGDNLYVKGYDAEGNQKEYKLDTYDEKTNIGTYTDESGKQVKIRNDN